MKKYIEMHPGRVLDSTLTAYRAALRAMGMCGAQACPAVGSALQESLANLQASLSAQPTATVVTETEEKVEEELKKWGGEAAEYYREKANEVKEIMLVLAGTAEIMAARDQRYAGQLGKMTGRLQAAADLEDISSIRKSIVQSASILKSCIDRMTKDSQESIRELQAKLAVFQARVEEADRIAFRDELTGLGNRRYMESQIDIRVTAAQPFSILVFDLNGFKKVNDAYGHVAGDDLLKQFGLELRAALRSSDVIARWGGDEFVVLLDTDVKEAQTFVDRIQKWVMGDYLFRSKDGAIKIPITAAVGLAGWTPGETGKALFERADASMYKQKGGNNGQRSRRQQPAAPVRLETGSSAPAGASPVARR